MILDFLFPRLCLGCEKNGGYVCAKCSSVLEDDFGGEIRVSDAHLEQLFFCLRYKKGGIVQKLIKQFKYKYSTEICKLFGEIFRKRIVRWHLRADVLVPAPTSRARLRDRGFNQSELLAKEICLKKVLDCLVRNDQHGAQAKLNRAGRINNLRGMIAMRSEFDVLGKKVLLVDDVATTMSTLKECARVLKASGAKSVCGVVIARGEC